MARRRKGNPVHGWLIVDKPAGMTSTAVVNKVKWALEAQKAGHAGTLDPSATGLLAVALGEATKTVPYITDAMKAYRFTVRFGQATNTDDAEGEILESKDKRPSAAEIQEALHQFVGDIEQVPPLFSAVKIDGERAYKKARDGENFELSSRPLFVESLELAERPDEDHAVLEMICGKGGYVRSIARDLGEALGCLAHVVTLRRIWSGSFDLDDAVTFETIKTLERTPELHEHLLALEAGLDEVPHMTCSEDAAARLRNGNPGMVVTSDAQYGDEAWVSCNGTPVAVGIYRAGELHPKRVFVLQ